VWLGTPAAALGFRTELAADAGHIFAGQVSGGVLRLAGVRFC